MIPLKKPLTITEITKKIEYFCVYQERSVQEVRQKLMHLSLSAENSDNMIKHLLDDNFINEIRFAKTFVRGKFRIKKWGKNKLFLELQRKGISNNTINLAFKEISDQEYLETFNELAKKKVKALTERNHLKKKKKFINYMLYRGWESSLIYEKANELIF